MPATYTEIRIGDQVRMRKAHPCGNDRWEVVRLGADIGIVCKGCSRRVLLPRPQFLRQVKTLLVAGPVADRGPSPDLTGPEPSRDGRTE
jgi:hypothetical protein